MPIRNPKNKTISFRLSHQEYARVEQVRQQRELESMSVLARCAVLAYSNHPPDTAEAKFESMKRRLEAVIQQVADLASRFEKN